MFIRALELFQFSMELNLSVATLRAGISDILYWLIIAMAVLIGYAITGYVVYFTIEEFSTIQSTMLALLRMTTGDFDIIWKMYELSPAFTPIYFTTFMIITIIFLSNIFIGLVYNHFTKELDLFEQTMSSANQQVFLWDVVYQVFSNYYILQKKKTHTAGKKLRCCRGLCPIPLFVIKLLDLWLVPGSNKGVSHTSSTDEEEEVVKDEIIEEVKP